MDAAQGENAEQGEDQNLVHEEPQIQEEEQTSGDSSPSVPLNGNSEAMGGSFDLPIALRKATRAATSRSVKKTSRSVKKYGFNVHDISNYISYESLSPSYRAFVTSLQSVPIPTDWRVAQQDPNWCAAMREIGRAHV